MKKPEISTQTSDPELVGGDGQSSWVHGRNCVYRDDTVAKFRVSIRTATGWKSYGHFHDLEAAAYVANVAILAEGCEHRYELNEVGAKDRQEVVRWRSAGRNASLEQLARVKYEQELRLQKERAEKERAEMEKARAEAEKAQAMLAAKQKERDEREIKLITEAPTAILLNLLTRDIGGEQHRKISGEIERRRGQKRKQRK